MPGVDDWINNPLEIVQKIFEEEKNDCHNTVVKYFARFLDREDSNKFIPSLNDVSLKHLKPNTLVRFRCMIQDMFDPEFYFNTYEVKNISTGQNILRCGLYKDLLSCEQTEEIIVQSPRNINSERLTYHCISVPGENAWVKDGFCHYSKLTSPNDTSACKEIVEEMDEFEIQVKRKRLDTDRTGNITEELPSSAANGLSDSNIPHLENDEIACIIKLYDTAENFKVTEVIECIGILDTSESKSNFNEMDEDIEMSSQVQSVSSLPKIHAIRIKPFLHNNPYLPINVNLENRLAMEIFSQARRLRHDLVRCFTHILLGDKLSAEYLLFNLISSVYYQQNITTLGKFCLNLMNIPTSNGYVKKLFSLLQKLTTKSYLLELSLQNLNTMNFIPRKDYTSNRLVSSILQLSPQTHLLIDETVLSPGQLNSTGINNISALNHLITWQQVEYDFKYHRIPYSSNISVLTLSQGKSILSSDCQIKLSATLPQENWEKYFTEVENYLTGENLKSFQNYLTLLKLTNYTLDEDIQKIIQEDFVNMRKDNNLMTGDDLHHLLVLARFQSLSCGEKCLSKENWETVKAMEIERKSRMQS